MATDTTSGGGGGGGSGTSGARAPFVPPSFYRTPYFPYANLDAQLQDALGLAGRGAGGFTNMASPLMQYIKNAPANLGGGLLGKSAYARGAPVGGSPVIPPITPGQVPGMPPTQTGVGTMPTGPWGTGTGLLGPVTMPPGATGIPNPGAYTGPGANPTGPAGPPGYAPTSASAAGGLLGKSAGAPAGSGGLAAWQDAQKHMTPDEIARVGKSVNSAGQYDPGQGSNWSASNLVSIFNSLPEESRGNFVNAIGQMAGKPGVPANIGAVIQQALRDSMGKSAADNWYAGVQNKQGSNIMSTQGLPSWITALL